MYDFLSPVTDEDTPFFTFRFARLKWDLVLCPAVIVYLCWCSTLVSLHTRGCCVKEALAQGGHRAHNTDARLFLPEDAYSSLKSWLQGEYPISYNFGREINKFF